jgi:hypothetical protein
MLVLLTETGEMKTAPSDSFRIHPEALLRKASNQVARRQLGRGLLLVTLLGPLCLGLAHGQHQRQTPITELRDSYDLVIAGAGTGGFGSAVQAARLGATVLLLEETDWIGGQMNAAAVTSMDEGPKHGDRPYILVRERGLYHEYVEAVVAYYQARGMTAETAYWRGHICMEPRVGQEILYRMLDAARGRTPALHVALRAKVTQALKSGDAVTGVEVELATAQGTVKRLIRSKVLVDATEWGDVIPLTGARYRVGNCTGQAPDPKREIQSLTWTAVIKQYPKSVPAELVVSQAPPEYAAAEPRLLKGVVAGERVDTKAAPWNFATFIGYRGMPNSEQPGAREITRTHMNYNNDYPVRIGDVEDTALRLATCRKAKLRTLQTLYYIQHRLGKTDWSVANDEGYDSPYNRAQVDQWIREQPELAPYRAILYQFPVMAYARESRRIMGLHTLTAREIERRPGSPTMFENTVALGDYAVDLHGSKKPELIELELDRVEDMPTKSFGERGLGPFAIPFECFIPEKVDGLVAAEKNISQSRLANGATRLQPSTMLMGQAAGAIAALSVKYGVRPRELDPVLVQQVLLAAGDTLQITPLKDVAKSGWEWPAVQLVTVHGLMSLDHGSFFPAAPLTSDALALVMKRLFNSSSSPREPITRATFARLLQPAMAQSGVKLEPGAALSEPARPITRLEAAQIVAGFLERRALKRLSRQEQTLPWPATKAPTPLRPEDIAPSPSSLLAADLRVLVEHGVIDSAEYWTSHALKESDCDGKRVGELLRKAARTIQPGTQDAQALEVCAAAGFFNSPDYWKQNAVEGRRCSGAHVATVIRRMAERLASMKQPEASVRKVGALSPKRPFPRGRFGEKSLPNVDLVASLMQPAVWPKALVSAGNRRRLRLRQHLPYQLFSRSARRTRGRSR